MLKKLQILCMGMLLSISTYAVTHNISVDAIGSPAKAAFSQTEAMVDPQDTVKVTNNTNVTILLGIPGVPFSLPINAGESFSYSPKTEGYGSVTVTLKTSSLNLPSNNVPLVLKEPTVVTPKDTDLDGIPDIAEILGGTYPDKADSDNDGINDGVEIGLPNYDADTTTRTNPLEADTDNGGALDGQEDTNGNGKVDASETDPSDPFDDVITSINTGTVAQNSLELYPQPATTEVYVNVSGTYTIVNHLGQQVLSGSVLASRINLELLVSGIYHLHINGHTQKLIVK